MQSRRITFLVSMILAMFVVAPVSAEDEWDEPNNDPWQGLNRVTHKFNDTADTYVLRPVARGYRKVVPGFARTGIRNFFGNLVDVSNSANNFLQGKPGDGFSDLGRILVNTTIGIGGFVDVATRMGLEKHEEDFGQTLSVWGIPRGPYLVIPFLGPSTVTDATGRPFDAAIDPIRYLKPVNHRNVIFAIEVVKTRENLLGAEKAVFGDKYLFYRDAYLQRREYLINDGEVEDSFDDF